MKDVYPVRVNILRRFTSGHLSGMTHSDSMGFLSVEDARDWAHRVTSNKKVNYEIISLTNAKTRETII